MGKDNSTKSESHECGSRFCKEFVEIVQLILDGEASKEHKDRFNKYYMECNDCISYYNLESSTIEFLKKKIEEEKVTVPVDLANEIRIKLGKTA
ncbi:MAG: hypothetical protein KTR26_07125 [Flammeovirgaceae bacterium]|nr:hypothetical protein [Flammeovirgaceae bacterium]